MATTTSRPTGKGSDHPEQSNLRPSLVLSHYETARAINIVKNNARLRALGLISAEEERKSNALAWGREDEVSTKKRKPSSEHPREGCRKSRRLSSLTSDITENVAKDENEQERNNKIVKEREALVKECREARQRAALEVAKLGVEIAGKENPTATYEHCLMRVRSMTEKGLINRVSFRKIIRFDHCFTKDLLVFSHTSLRF